MSTNPEPRYDFIVVSPKQGEDRTAIKSRLVGGLGAKPEKVDVLLAYLEEKGPVEVEKAVTAARLEELKRKWESAGLVTTAKEALTILEDASVERGKPMFTCPACGHKQEQRGDPEIAQCEKCGVFEHKYREAQRKKELYLKEREKLTTVQFMAQQQAEKEAKEAAEAAEKEAIRKQIEEELGLNKKPKGLKAWLTMGGEIGPATRGAIGAAVVGVVLAFGWFARGLISPQQPPPETAAKQAAAQAKQEGEAVQKAVGQMIVGSKKMAQASGAAEQFGKQIFPNGDKDVELLEQMQSAQAANAEANGALAERERADGLAQAARNMADAGGDTADAERALSMSMQSAKLIKDEKQRAEKVSEVANAQFEVHTLDARRKAASGDWRGADKAFSKAMDAATDITTKAQAAAARTSVAKARAETGDYGGAALIFLDAVKTAEEIPNLGERALALADVAKSIAESSNEIGGASERVFARAIAVAASIPDERGRRVANDDVLYRRVEAAGNVAGFLLSTGNGVDALKQTMDRAANDADLITEPMPQAKAFGILARSHSESGVTGPAADDYHGRIAKLVQAAPEPQRELMAAIAARAKGEALAAAAKFSASKGQTGPARQGFLQAMQAANGIATKSTDPGIRNEIAKQRSEALSAVARYMQAAGDKRTAAKVFALATGTAKPKGP